MSGLKASLLDERGVIAISGEDARSFLQALITNNIDEVVAGRAIYAALLTPQGKYLFDFFITEQEGRLLLDCARDRVPDLVKRLGFYKLRAKVTIEDVSSQFSVAALWGAPLTLPQEIASFPDPRLAALGFRALLPAQGAQSLLARAGANIVDADHYAHHRIAQGIGDASDFEPERSFPLELNFDLLNGIDFKKGCFIGQEVTSRVKRRGSVRKRLMHCQVQGALPSPGSAVLSGEREVGSVFSVDTSANSLLALLRLDALALRLTVGDAVLVPAPASWLAHSIEEAAHAPDE